MRIAAALIWGLFFSLLALSAPKASAQLAGPLAAPAVSGRYASIAVDADSREILHARQIDALRYPASLTKMMTLYLAFDAIDNGTLSLDEHLTISVNAASQVPVKLGLRAGAKISVHDAVQALAVKSSNDIAVALAERIGGNEINFAAMMTRKAGALGMGATTYRNASGLPDPLQVTTARDQAKLADNILRNHRRHYHYFGQKTFRWKGRALANHNTLLGRVAGVDGFKTGYTRASGYNLTISAQRNGRRIIAVVLGGASGESRDDHMERLIDRAFEVIDKSPVQIARSMPVIIPASHKSAAASPAPLQAFTLRGKGKSNLQVITGDGARDPNTSQAALQAALRAGAWSVQIGAFDSRERAHGHINALQADSGLNLVLAQGEISQARAGNGGLYRARLTGLSPKHAQDTCAALKAVSAPCFVIAP